MVNDLDDWDVGLRWFTGVKYLTGNLDQAGDSNAERSF